MLVAVTGFGSVWRTRFSKNEHDLNRFAHGAYFNTTGVMVNGHVRQRPLILGYAKFNGAGGFDPNFPSRMINRVFECADMCVWNGENKVLFRRVLRHGQVPDLFLVVARPRCHWKTIDGFGGLAVRRHLAAGVQRRQTTAGSHVANAGTCLDP